jgi:hypothetical protein
MHCKQDPSYVFPEMKLRVPISTAAFQDKTPKNILGMKQESGLAGAENGI